MSGFRIASLGVAGGETGLCPIPGRTGAYAADLGAILAWRPALALTMITSREMAGA